MAANEYLLDTQVALWIMLGDKRVSEGKFRDRFVSGDSKFIFHQASTWEIQIKYSLGKLKLSKRPETFLRAAVDASGFEYASIEDAGIFFLDKLPAVHRDPFDRMLIAHALVNGWTVISSDSQFESYPIKLELL